MHCFNAEINDTKIYSPTIRFQNRSILTTSMEQNVSFNPNYLTRHLFHPIRLQFSFPKNDISKKRASNFPLYIAKILAPNASNKEIYLSDT